MDTTLLRAFIETTDAGTLSRAARNLELSQPSLTAQIQRLEKHLGAPLFDRHGRGVTLTDAGKALYPRARRILDDVRTTEDVIRNERVEGAGTLSVGAIPTVAPYVLPPALQRMRARHAAMRVELREDYSAVLAKLLLDGVLDVVIAALPYPFEHLDTEALGMDALVVAVPVPHAAARAGRSPGSVQLVAVSKTYPAADVLQVLGAGQAVFGENRVQEAAAKFGPLRAGHPGLRLHLIGPLQTNKARDAVRAADVIETLDRPRLADAIADALGREGMADGAGPSLLVQVNVGDEPQKAGVLRADADAFIEQCQSRLGTAVTGLMCIPPADAPPGPHFVWLAATAARHGLHTLSMGMSADFEIAIMHGATHIRVGSALFGARTAPP